MTEAEVLNAWGASGVEEYYYELSSSSERRYVGGLDTFHTLHRVEGLQKTLLQVVTLSEERCICIIALTILGNGSCVLIIHAYTNEMAPRER